MQAQRQITPLRNFESIAWKWMRYSGLALIPLVWIHVLLQDIIVGVHAIAETEGGAHLYVLARWGDPLWITFDILLLAFTFAHGMNGLRQVLGDFIHSPKAERIVGWIIFLSWLIISAIGGAAIVMAAQEMLSKL